MCGIAGLLDLSGAPADRSVLLRMLRRIEHRGPDGGAWLEDDGVSLFQGDRRSPRPFSKRPSPGAAGAASLKVALGHQRLAITDLSEAGRQPMCDSSGRWWIVFNGAIYNAPELRAELEAEGEEFSTSTDTEVLLAAYVRWGPKALERFNGMWAFAIWDASRRELFSARDRFAIKPFYYTLSGSLFAFASEPKALRVVQAAEPNLERVRAFLEVGATLDGSESTCYASYWSLPAGSLLRIDANGLGVERWYDLDERAAAIVPPSTLEDAAERLQGLLEDAVAVRLRADVPVGLLLSGGVDSSGIAGFLCRDGARGGFSGRTISTRYPGRPDIDESFYIGEVLRATGFAGEFIEPSTAEFDEDLDDYMDSVEDLTPSSIFYAEWLLYRQARRLGLTVMLSGQGSDELFGGYEPWDVHVRQLWNRRERLQAVREGLFSGRRQWGVIRGARHTLGVLRTARRPLPCGCRSDGFLQAHQRHLLLLDYLPALLAFEDRNSMSWGIEARLPFLDYRVVEFARSLREDFLLRNGWTKVVLRAALTGIAPKSVLRRPRKLGLPGPLEGRHQTAPELVRKAWQRLVDGGWTEPGISAAAPLVDRQLGFRARILDAWIRRCLGAAT
jgi:asparagine synthase (glutamine-hydrolysing)